MNPRPPVVWLLAAENDWIPGGKVGGVGDVIRDLPGALARQGWQVRVIVPSYGAFHKAEGAELIGPIRGRFAGAPFEASAWRLPGCGHNVEQVVLDHYLLNPGPAGRIYHSDPSERPFATDAGKFAFFCAAVAAWIEALPTAPDVVHLHDWHTGLLPFLRQCSAPSSGLRQTRMVFTVHNLAYQGIRPVWGDESAFSSWFPERLDQVQPALHPGDHGAINFMATALRLADGIATVSPTYAKEILRPNNDELGLHGGEGLELLLQKAADEHRLVGILNGCEYPGPEGISSDWHGLVDAILAEPALASMCQEKRQALGALRAQRPGQVWLSIGRIVAQKIDLFLTPVEAYPTALDALLARLGTRGVFILLGSGDVAMEQALEHISERNGNFFFLRGYAEGLSDRLYASTDLFVMPSSFEPCGISQMLALRAGQPCLVHGVGGLADTVSDGQNGFVFNGESPARQAEELVHNAERALALRVQQPECWAQMQAHAAEQRFSWDIAAGRYINELYLA